MFPRTLFKDKRKVLALGLSDTLENRERAARLAERANLDVAMGEFDWTLETYRDRRHPKKQRSPATSSIPTVEWIWGEFMKYKKPQLKPRSWDKLKVISAHIRSCPTQSLDALAFRSYLIRSTTNGQAKDCLMYLSAACNWAVKHSLISENPFEGMYRELPPHNWQINSLPNAFLPWEKDRIIEAFKASEYYVHYAPFVQFLFLTGCRPSEAIGLVWEKVTADFSRILFDSALVQVGNGERVRSQGSKNNKSRWFPCGQTLSEILQTHKPKAAKSSDLIFPSPRGKSIHYRNFCRRAWVEVVFPLVKRKTTPYCCRDTFISEQIAKGVNPAIVARWCDSSTKEIEKKYLDNRLLEEIKPID